MSSSTQEMRQESLLIPQGRDARIRPATLFHTLQVNSIGHVTTRGKSLMQLAKFVRTLGPILVVGLAGLVVGCGSGAQNSFPEGAPDAQTRKDYQKQARLEAKKGIGTGRADRIPKAGSR